MAVPHFWSAHRTFHGPWHAQIFLWTYTTNLAFVFGHATLPYLAHLWSLSVEEQFYLLWPLAVFLVPTRRLPMACCVLIAIGIFSRIASASFGLNGSQIYFFTPCRMDEFGIGALVATLSRVPGWEIGRLARPAVWVFPIAAIAGFSSTFVTGKMPAILGSAATALGFTAISLAFASLLILASVPRRRLAWVGSFFRIKAMRSTGKYSYAMYVFHVPVMGVLSLVTFHTWLGKRFSEYHLFQVSMLCACVAGTYLLAFCSYHLYEKHFLKLKKYFPEKVAVA